MKDWPDFWPVWDQDEPVVVVAAGPSLTKEDVDYARERAKIVVINESWRLCPSAEILYACDWIWWQHRAPKAEEFRGLRVIGKYPPENMTPAPHQWIRELPCLRVRPGEPRMIFEGKVTGAGGNSAFQVTNALVRRGAKKIILLGVDCKNPGQHWHGTHDFPGHSNQRQKTLDSWLRAWSMNTKVLDSMGVSVVNCSRDTALTCFPMMGIEKAI